MIITSTELLRHMRVNSDFGIQVNGLFKSKQITQAANNLLKTVLDIHWETNVAIQLTKDSWVDLTQINPSHFSREYKCLTDHGIWKKIKGLYVISPCYIFNGSDFFQKKAIEAWLANKSFIKQDVYKLSSDIQKLNKDKNNILY